MGILSIERVQFEAALNDLLALYYGMGGAGNGQIPISRLRIINVVKAKIDELIPEGEGVQFSLHSPPNVSNPYDLFISAVLDEATKNTIMMAPVHLLEPTIYIPTAIKTLEDDWGETGYIELPENFLRFILFKMAEWERPASEVISISSPLYLKQKNKFSRGFISKPVVAFSWFGTEESKKRILEYFSVPVGSEHAVEMFQYMPETKAEDLQSNLIDVLTWVCASKVLQITGQLDLSGNAMEQAVLCLNNL